MHIEAGVCSANKGTDKKETGTKDALVKATEKKETKNKEIMVVAVTAGHKHTSTGDSLVVFKFRNENPTQATIHKAKVIKKNQHPNRKRAFEDEINNLIAMRRTHVD